MQHFYSAPSPVFTKSKDFLCFLPRPNIWSWKTASVMSTVGLFGSPVLPRGLWQVLIDKEKPLCSTPLRFCPLNICKGEPAGFLNLLPQLEDFQYQQFRLKITPPQKTLSHLPDIRDVWTPSSPNFCPMSHTSAQILVDSIFLGSFNFPGTFQIWFRAPCCPFSRGPQFWQICAILEREERCLIPTQQT